MNTIKERKLKKDRPQVASGSTAYSDDYTGVNRSVDWTDWRTIVRYLYPSIIASVGALMYIAYTRYYKHVTSTRTLSASETLKDVWFDLKCSDSTTLPYVEGRFMCLWRVAMFLES